MTLGSSWRTSCGPYLRTYLYLLILTGDNVTRLELEDELWAVRAMRHVYRIKPNLSLQGWVTVLNPVLRGGYPSQWALTTEGGLTEPTFPSVGYKGSPEYRATPEYLLEKEKEKAEKEKEKVEKEKEKAEKEKAVDVKWTRGSRSLHSPARRS